MFSIKSTQILWQRLTKQFEEGGVCWVLKVQKSSTNVRKQKQKQDLGYEKLTTVFQWCGKRNKTKKSIFFVAVMFHFYSLSLFINGHYFRFSLSFWISSFILFLL
jgi:hypothetical protein